MEIDGVVGLRLVRNSWSSCAGGPMANAVIEHNRGGGFGSWGLEHSRVSENDLPGGLGLHGSSDNLIERNSISGGGGIGLTDHSDRNLIVRNSITGSAGF